MAISTNGLQLVRLAGAAFNQQLSASDYSEILTANKTAAELDAWANAAVAAEFRGKTTTDIAKAVLANVGLSSVAGLEAWVAGQLTAGGGVAKAGATMLSLLNDYSNMSTTEAIYGASVVTFNQKAANSQALSQTAGTAGGTYAAVSTATPSTPFTLTTGVDLKTTGAGADTFTSVNPAIATATLTAGDNLDGGAGVDTLTITSAAEMTIGSGVTMNNVENVTVSASGGALTLDTALMTGITSVTNSGSSQAVTVNNLKALVPVTVTGASANTTATFAAAVTSGAADAVTLNLNAVNTTGASAVSVVLAGFETVNVASSGSASGATGNSGVTVDSTTLTTLNVTGATAAKLTANLIGATNNVTGTVTSDDGAHDVNITADATDKLSVSMGAGNDQVRVANLSATHTIAGGDGTDTLRYSGADTQTLATTANVTGIETVTLSNATPASFAMTGAGVTTVNYVAAAAGTFGGLSTGGTIGLNVGGSMTAAAAGAAASATAAATLTAATYSGATDSLTVNVGLATTTAPGATASTVSAVGVESVTFNSLAASGSTEARAITFADTTATTAALKSITVTNNIPALTTVAVTNSGTSALTTVNLSGVTSGASFSGGATAGATITGGAGNDSLTGGAGPDNISGGEGNDTIGGAAGADTIDAGNGTNSITGGAGADSMTGGTGADTYAFVSNATTAATPILTSTSTAADTITNFTSGTDKISITGTYAPTKFLGNFTNIQSALSAQAGPAGQAFSAAYVTGESTLYVFQLTTGLSHVDDMVIKLTNVATLAEGDFNIGSLATGITITSSLTSATILNVGLTGTPVGTSNSPVINTTDLNDIVGAHTLNITAATLTGGAGSDTLNIANASVSTTAQEYALTPGANITGFETITLPDAVSTVGSSFTLNTASVAANSTVAISGAAFTGLDINGTPIAGTGLTITAAATASNAKVNITGSSVNDSLTGGAGNDTISGGLGADTISGGLAVVSTGAGINSLSGGDGADLIIVGGDILSTEVNVLSGGTGVDTLQIGGTASTVARLVNLIGSTVTGLENLDLAANTGAANAVTMTGAQYQLFTGTKIGLNANDTITITTAPTIAVTAGDGTVLNISVAEGTTMTIAAAATAAAQIITETGTAGTVSTFTLGTGAYTGDWVGIDALDVIKVVDTTDVAGNTGFDTGVVYDFQSASATLTLNLTQNGLAGTTFLNASTGTQVIALSAADTFDTNTAIESYTALAASVVTIAAGHTAVNLAAAAGTNTTVVIGGQTVTGTFAFDDGTDVITATTGSNIAGVNAGGVTTAEAITITGAVTMTRAQLAALTITAAGAADSVTLTTAGAVTSVPAIETWVLANGSNTVTLGGITASQTITGGTGSDVINNGAATTTINQAISFGVDTATDRYSVINAVVGAAVVNVATISNFDTARDALSTILGTVTATSGLGFLTAPSGGNLAVVLAGTPQGSIINITNTNVSAAQSIDTANDGAIETIIIAALGSLTGTPSYTFVVYGDGNAYIYQGTIADSGTNNDITVAADVSIEHLITLTGVLPGTLTAANFF